MESKGAPQHCPSLVNVHVIGQNWEICQLRQLAPTCLHYSKTFLIKLGGGENGVHVHAELRGKLVRA